ncbi:MAG: ComF family protein [Patescibacteria group bacterium]|nr:ComF family protein [Patescibacteria group bacterium]MDD5490267.1 ComF family protein [Patescibacteria group bacterium]
MNSTGGWREKIFEVRKFFLDLIFPVECLGCKREGQWLCDDCFRKIKPILSNFAACPFCGKVAESEIPGELCERHNFYLDGIWSACDYKEKLIERAICLLKYNFVEDLSGDLAKLLTNHLERLRGLVDLNNFFNYIVPVPLHLKRRAERGFNQSELLAREVADFLSLPFRSDVLKRVKYTPPQVSLDGEKRRVNLKDAFYCDPSINLHNKKILLIDDVFTTGSTFNECARVLKKSGAALVWGLTIARSG